MPNSGRPREQEIGSDQIRCAVEPRAPHGTSCRDCASTKNRTTAPGKDNDPDESSLRVMLGVYRGAHQLNGGDVLGCVDGAGSPFGPWSVMSLGFAPAERDTNNNLTFAVCTAAVEKEVISGTGIPVASHSALNCRYFLLSRYRFDYGTKATSKFCFNWPKISTSKGFFSGE